MPDQGKDTARQDSASAYVANTIQQTLPSANDQIRTSNNGIGRPQDLRSLGSDPFQQGATNGNSAEADVSWEMIGLGLEEPLPPQDVMDDL